MVTLDLDEYTLQLQNLVKVLNEYSNQSWTLINYPSYIVARLEDWVRQKTLDKKIRRVVEIHYDVVYSLPKIWFNFYTKDWNRMTIEEIFESGIIEEAILIQLKSIPTFTISSGENPITKTPFYHFHACRTEEMMREKQTFLLRWLSFFGMYINLHYDLLFLTKMLNSYCVTDTKE
uniref:Ubiquitin-like-conjugating enzyme ATG10 n=1 Tax=Parastrongyloides trichosuri TaxID=131310 RepID=A0A0N5A3X8_PARTI